MGVLDSLLANPSQQQDYQDFVGRYQQVAPNLSPQEYQAAAEQSYARLSPQERLQLGQYLQQQAQQQGLAGFGQGVPVDQYQDPRYLARATAQVHQQQPGLLGGLLGGSGGGSNPLAKAALAGIAAAAVSRALGGGLLGGAGRPTGPMYRIRNAARGKLLADPQGSRDDGTRIIQWDDTGGPDQAWQLDRGPHGQTRLWNGGRGKLLANPQGSRDNGTEIIQWREGGGAAQGGGLVPAAGGGGRGPERG